MHKTWLLSAFLLLTLLPGIGVAATRNDLFAALRDSGVDYENTGAVCEQAARLELSRHFPSPAYEAVTGVIYGDLSQSSLGELDVVIFDTRSAKAVLIAEVKCWRNLRSARAKATEQRARFLRTMETPQNIDFRLAASPWSHFRPEQFLPKPRFIAISQRGGLREGFEQELELPLEDLMRLRLELMACQDSGECRRP